MVWWSSISLVLRSRSFVAVIVLALSVAMTAAIMLNDATITGRSEYETLGQAVTCITFTGRPTTVSHQLLATPTLADQPAIAALAAVHTGRPRRELTFGGVTASFASLGCLFHVYLI